MVTKGNGGSGSAAARNRRVIYILCALTVLLSAVALFVLEKSPTSPESSPPTAENPPPGRGDSPSEPDSVAPSGDEHGTAAGADPVVTAPTGKIAELREANAFFDTGIEKLKAAMNATPGADETEELKILALENFLKAQTAYEAYLERYPEEERSLDRRMTDLAQQIYWCRKTMRISSFPTTGNESEPHPESSRPESSRPESSRPPTPRVEPAPTFRPDAEAAKFKAAAAKALKEGRPDQIIELGAPLMDDPRMEGHLDEIPRAVALARGMQAVLAGALKSLMPRVGSAVTLALRDRTISGRLRAVDEGIMIQDEEGVETIRVSSLAAGEIAARAEEAGALDTPQARFAAGAYFALRGDLEEGARQLIMARAGGEDVAEYSHVIERALRESAEIRALSDWVDLVPRLGTPGPELYAALDNFKSNHRQSALFKEHREELFKALGAAGETTEFEIADLYRVLDRNPGKTVKLEYDFGDSDQFLDFGSRGEWTVTDGALTGTKGVVWIERFDLKNVDVRLVLRSAVEFNLVIWEGGWDQRGGLNFDLKPEPEGLVATFHNGRQRLAREVIRMPRDEVEVHIKMKGDKFQVAINRKVVLKGDGAERTEEKRGRVLAFNVKSEPVLVDELELKTDLDLDWARAGGTHQARWIRDYHVTGPFTLSKWQVQVALEHQEWPEVEPFDPEKLADNGQPVWTYVRPDEGRLDLNRMKPNDRIFAYAVVRVWSPDRRTALLEVQADDAARAWLNDELVLDMVPLGEARRVEVKLNPGDNLLLLKVADEKQSFWLRSRLLTKTGEFMPDVICW